MDLLREGVRLAGKCLACPVIIAKLQAGKFFWQEFFHLAHTHAGLIRRGHGFPVEIGVDVEILHVNEMGWGFPYQVAQGLNLACLIRDAWENKIIDHGENTSDTLTDFCSDFLGHIIESALEEFESFEEFEKWKAANERPVYNFLDTDDYISEMYGSYDELVIFYDPTCDCFGKDKIKKEIVIDY